MLRSIRENIQGRLAKVILALIIIPFVFFGAESLLTSSGGSSAVLKVNGEKISERDLAQEMQLVHRETLAQMGEEVDYEQLSESVIRPKALDRLEQTTLLRQLSDDLKMSVPETLLEQSIVSMPAFQVDGKYSGEQMKLALADVGMPLPVLKSKISDGFRLGYFRDGIAGSEFLIAQDLNLLQRIIGEVRDVEWVELPHQQIMSDLVVTDDEVKAFYDNNQDSFYTDLTVVAEYLVIDQQDFAEPVDESQLQEEYKKQLDQFIPDETREIAHILLEVSNDQTKDKALQVAAEIQQALAAGGDFFELAQRYSQDAGSASDGGRLGFIEKDGSFPPEFEAAAFAVEEGGVAGPVVTDAGVHLIKVTAVDGSELPSFDKMKDVIESQIQRRVAREKYVETVERVADIAFNAADLSEPASQLNLPLQEIAGVGKSGISAEQSDANTHDIFSDKRVISALFSDEILRDGLNSELIEINATKSVVLRVKKVVEPRMKSLAEVQESVRQQLLAERAANYIEQRATAIADMIRAGGSFEAVAKRENLNAKSMPINRQSAEVDSRFVQQVFMAPRSALGTGVQYVVGDQISYVFRVNAVTENADLFNGEVARIFERQSRTFFAQQNFTAFVKTFEQDAEVEKF